MNPHSDARNLVDSYKGMPVGEIARDLKAHSHSLHIAIENLERDFNMGTIVRTANAFNVAGVHIIGRRQWNKRGAMATDKYLQLYYHDSVQSFVDSVEQLGLTIVAVDNVQGSKPIQSTPLVEQMVLVFGSEANGISAELLEQSNAIVHIEQFGSTRSINVGVAAGIAMYEWLRQNILSKTV